MQTLEVGLDTKIKLVVLERHHTSCQDKWSGNGYTPVVLLCRHIAIPVRVYCIEKLCICSEEWRRLRSS
jgi:hypothetical protein